MDSGALEGVQLLKFALNFASAEPRGVAETCGQLLETFSSRARGRGLPDGDLFQFPDLRKLIKGGPCATARSPTATTSRFGLLFSSPQPERRGVRVFTRSYCCGHAFLPPSSAYCRWSWRDTEFFRQLREGKASWVTQCLRRPTIAAFSVSQEQF